MPCIGHQKLSLARALTHTGEERASRGKEHSPPVVKPTIERLCTADFERHIPIAVCIPFCQKLRAVASN